MGGVPRVLVSFVFEDSGTQELVSVTLFECGGKRHLNYLYTSLERDEAVFMEVTNLRISVRRDERGGMLMLDLRGVTFPEGERKRVDVMIPFLDFEFLETDVGAERVAFRADTYEDAFAYGVLSGEVLDEVRAALALAR